MNRNDLSQVRVGVKFKSTTFFGLGEIASIRESENEVDVIITSTDNLSHIEKNWNLKEVRDMFDKKHYLELVNKNEISVW